MTALDLRHLRVFLALHATKNVTHAAQTLGLSQSAVSVVLAQLRRHYDDPLFVRTSGGMQATPRVELLLPVLRQAMLLLDQSLEQAAQFDPADSTRTFRVCMTDVGQITLLPRLLAKLHQAAPNVRIEVANLTHATTRQLEAGEVDLAMGFTEEIIAGFYRQKLFDEGFACIVARDHPRIVDGMTAAQLQQEKYVKVLVSATAHSIVDKILVRKGVHRVFAVSVPSFLGLGQMVASSHFVAIVPLRLGAIFAAQSAVKIVSLPVKFPSYVVNQYWHDRYHRDPGNVWLRSLVHETATSLPLKASMAAQGM